MKLTMLGTSHGVPSKTRYCSSYMLEAGGNIYIFDGGAPVIDLLLRKGKDLTKVKAFFNTHFHSDHILGILSMVTLFGWYYKETDIDILLPDEKNKNIFIDFINSTANAGIPNERIRIEAFKEGTIFDDGVIRVQAIPTNHKCGNGNRAYAFFIEAEGKSVLYTGDMSAELDDFPKVAFDRFIDVIISECAHFPVRSLEEYMNRVNTHTFVVSHVFPLSKINEIEAIADKYDFEVLAAADDDEIEF